MITAVDKLTAIRDAGYQVHVRHERVTEDLYLMTAWEANEKDRDIRQHGGQTTVEVMVAMTAEKLVRIAKGVAVCSFKDRFERRKGLELALGRAIADAPELRAVIKEMVAAKAATA